MTHLQNADRHAEAAEAHAAASRAALGSSDYAEAAIQGHLSAVSHLRAAAEYALVGDAKESSHLALTNAKYEAHEAADHTFMVPNAA